MKEPTQPEVAASSEGEASDHAQSRRDFMWRALTLLPATGLVAGCAVGPDGAFEVRADPPAVGKQLGPLLSDCPSDDVQLRRSRWLQLHAAFVGCENLHDLPGITASFGPEATLVMNELPFDDARSIAEAHVLFGMSSGTGGLSGTQVLIDREYFTDDGLLIHGRVLGTHVGQILRFPPTFQQVEMHYAAIYHFDDAGKLVSERVVMNWGPLAGA